MDEQVEEIKNWLDALDDAVDAEDYGRYEDILQSLYRDGHLKYLVQQAEQLHGTRYRKGYKTMYGECNVDYANLNSENKHLKEKVQELEEENKALQETSILNANEAVSLQEENKRYKEALEFYGNEINYQVFIQNGKSNIERDNGEKARQELKGAEV